MGNKNMWRMAVALFTVWTYGSEALDGLAERAEWLEFSARLGCKVRADRVWCLVGNRWETIENRPLDLLIFDYSGAILNHESK